MILPGAGVGVGTGVGVVVGVGVGVGVVVGGSVGVVGVTTCVKSAVASIVSPRAVTVSLPPDSAGPPASVASPTVTVKVPSSSVVAKRQRPLPALDDAGVGLGAGCLLGAAGVGEVDGA